MISKYLVSSVFCYNARMQKDSVERVRRTWNRERPELDSSRMTVVLRIQRIAKILNDRAADALADHDLEWWEYDVLSTLRRQGEPFELTPSELARQTMLSTGAMTNRVDRLIKRDFVTRRHDEEDRRRVLVQLNGNGLEAVDAAAESRFDTADRALESLSEADAKKTGPSAQEPRSRC